MRLHGTSVPSDKTHTSVWNDFFARLPTCLPRLEWVEINCDFDPRQLEEWHQICFRHYSSFVLKLRGKDHRMYVAASIPLSDDDDDDTGGGGEKKTPAPSNRGRKHAAAAAETDDSPRAGRTAHLGTKKHHQQQQRKIDAATQSTSNTASERRATKRSRRAHSSPASSSSAPPFTTPEESPEDNVDNELDIFKPPRVGKCL